MMFTRAQVRKPKSSGHNSNQKMQSRSSHKHHNLQQQQHEWDTHYTQSPPRNGRVHDWERNRGWDKDRDRDRDRDRERERDWEYYSDRSNFSTHKSHSYELPRQHSKEKAYTPFYEHEMDHSAVGDCKDRRTRPRSITNRRGAIKQLKTHDYNGHRFVAKFFRQPTFCAFCNLFVWGFGKKGYQCITCQTAVHKKCHEKLLSKCSGSVFNSASTILLRERFKIDMPHRFKPYTFMSPTFCDHCGSLMAGFFIQGLKCEECDVNCHKKCEHLMANLCGVNQKLIVEALACVKRGNRYPKRISCKEYFI
uniref:protein kinase C n=1 Tax=Bactrocera latifrons TaxID=174628 RepID=A0A0K8VWR1_BACLA